MKLFTQGDFLRPNRIADIDIRIDDVHLEETDVVTLFEGDQPMGKLLGGENTSRFLSPTLRHV